MKPSGYSDSGANIACELLKNGLSLITPIDNHQTKLKLTYTVIESFPNNIPEFTRESGIEGWNHFIKDSLNNKSCILNFY
ncbi:MAG: hypothetical protein QM504_10085 [Pseudomonadota bacterium]